MLPSLQEVRDLLIERVVWVLSQDKANTAAYEKADGSVVTEVDEALQTAIRCELDRRWPEYPFLGEEMSAGQQTKLLSDFGHGLWCLDPLDGTTNFASNIPFYSVSLALLQEGAPVLGIIYDPLRRECFSAQRGVGAWLDDEQLRCRSSGGRLASSVAVVDFKRLRPSLARRLVQAQPFRSQRNFGSCALEWCWLAAGRFHVYLHGGMKLWDYAAGSLVLAETGGHSCTLEGEPVVNARQSPRSVVAGLDADLFAQWRCWLGICASGRGVV
jgi:myo-inositol-1(or 4)-monophosphatase